MPDTFSPLNIALVSELADKLREYFPQADSRSIAEYLAALRAYEIARTAATLDHLMVVAHLLATPTIDIDLL